VKKQIGIAILLLVFTAIICGTVAATTSIGPAPESHDGDPEGSGFVDPNWENGVPPGPGPAPNSGDGIPDGSGF
jgi:hypothetical protein